MVSVRRPEIAQRIHDAKEHGDLSENAEYEDAKNEQAFVEGRIQTLESMIKNATLIDEHTSTDHVQIGSTVKVKGEDGAETFMIVGSAEAKPADGPHLQRVAGRPRPARPQEGRQGRRQGPRRRLRLHDRRDQLARPGPSRRPASGEPGHRPRPRRGSTVDWADELAASVQGPQVVNDSKTPSGHRPRREPPRPRHPRRHHARPARPRPRDHAPVRRRRPGPDGRPGAADARRRSSARWARPLAHVPDQAGDCHASYARHHAQTFIDVVRRASASTPTATTG